MSEKTIFKEIIDGEVPAYRIFEDEHFLIFLDAFPASPGHSLIIPKQEVRFVWDAPLYTEYLALAKKLALAHRDVFDTDMIYMDVRGDEVPHAHIHVRPNLPKDGSEKNFEHWQEKIREAFEKQDV